MPYIKILNFRTIYDVRHYVITLGLQWFCGVALVGGVQIEFYGASRRGS